VALSISQVYWYFAVAADFDISADVVKFALDGNTLATGGGVPGTYVAPGALPPSAAARHTAGLYWFRVQAGPNWPTGLSLPLVTGDNTVYARVTDNPEAPVIHYALTTTD
jgi:hypothetical protein